MEKRRLPSIITKTLNLLTWMIPVLERMPKTTPFMAMANRVVECTLDGLTCGLKALHEQNLEYRKQLIEAFIDNLYIVQSVWTVTYSYSSYRNEQGQAVHAKIISARQNASFVTMAGEIARMADNWLASTVRLIQQSAHQAEGAQ